MLKKWLPGLIGLSAFALLGRLLGFAREILMASKFGATDITDAYLTTLLLFDIAMAANASILSGTLSYSTEIKNFNGFTKSLFGSGLKIFAIVIAGAVVLYPVIGWIVPVIFSKSPEATKIVIDTSRLLLGLAAFLAAGGIFSAILQLKGDITNPGKLIIFLNVASISFLIFFSKNLGILSLPLGLLLGGILFFAYQLLLIKKFNVGDEENPGGEKLKLAAWGGVVILVFGNSLLPSVSGLIERYFAYSFAEGTFSHYQYAIKIILLPLTIIGFAISTSLLPIQTRSVNTGNHKEFEDATNKGILVSVLTSSFFVLIFSILSKPVITLIYQRGHFSPGDTLETSTALQIMAVGLIPFLLNPVLANIFYSLKAVKKLIVINLFFIGIQTILLILFSKLFSGIEALATAWVITGWINNAALVYYLIKFKKVNFDRPVILKLSMILLITAVIIILGKEPAGYLFTDALQSGWSLLINLLIAGFVLLLIFGGAVYFVFRETITNLFKRFRDWPG